MDQRKKKILIAPDILSIVYKNFVIKIEIFIWNFIKE